MNLYIIESKGSSVYRLPSGDNQLQGLSLKHGGNTRFTVSITPDEGLTPITSLRFGIRRSSGKERLPVLIAEGKLKAPNIYEMDIHLNNETLNADFVAALALGRTILQYEAEFEWMRVDADGNACRSSSSIIGLSLTHAIIQTGDPATPELAQYPAPSALLTKPDLATHNTQSGVHANIRNEYINNLVPSAGMAGQVLIRHGATAGQYRWQTPPWITADSADVNYMSKHRPIVTDTNITVQHGLGLLIQPWVDGVSYCIANKRGVLGYMPCDARGPSTDFVGFVPFASAAGGGNSMSFDQYKFDNLPSQISLEGGVYKINLTYYFKNSNLTSCIPNVSYGQQMKYLRPFDLSSSYVHYTSTVSCVPMPGLAGVFMPDNPHTLAVTNLINPEDLGGTALIVNPGDYIDYVCAGNKYPFTGYSYINIELLLSCPENSPENLFAEGWRDHIASWYTPYVNMTIIKLQ